MGINIYGGVIIQQLKCKYLQEYTAASEALVTPQKSHDAFQKNN